MKEKKFKKNQKNPHHLPENFLFVLFYSIEFFFIIIYVIIMYNQTFNPVKSLWY